MFKYCNLKNVVPTALYICSYSFVLPYCRTYGTFLSHVDLSRTRSVGRRHYGIKMYTSKIKPHRACPVHEVSVGDANQDAIVDGGDMAAIDNSSTAVRVGYYPEDLNGVGIVDASDMAIIDNNSTSVVHVVRP